MEKRLLRWSQIEYRSWSEISLIGHQMCMEKPDHRIVRWLDLSPLFVVLADTGWTMRRMLAATCRRSLLRCPRSSIVSRELLLLLVDDMCHFYVDFWTELIFKKNIFISLMSIYLSVHVCYFIHPFIDETFVSSNNILCIARGWCVYTQLCGKWPGPMS